MAAYYRRASPAMATFVSNHDIFAGQRLWDQLGGDQRRYRLAAAGYLLQPGTPFVYYGEEIGQAGVPGLAADQPLRSPMSWTADPRTAGFTSGTPFRPPAPNVARHNVAAQRRDPASLYNFYKALIGLRNTLPSLARGSYEGSFAQGLVAGWQRKWAQEHTVVLINYASAASPAQIEGLPAGARLLSAYPAGGAQVARADARGVATLLLAPQQVRVLQVESRPEADKAARPPKAKPAGRGPTAEKPA